MSPTKADRDCADMARGALFPKQINRDGSHTTIFPAVEALNKVRDDAMAANPNRAGSSFFPKRVVVVKAVGHDDTLQWNGQPDIEDKDASFEVIPRILSVRCMECVDLKAIGEKAFLETSKTGEGKEIVLCSDRLGQSAAVVEETLAHKVTLVGEQLEYERNSSLDDPTTCKGLALSEINAARAAECYYNKNGKEVKRGSCLPVGYSFLPAFLQRKIMYRCVRSVATRAVTETFGNKEGQKCVDDGLDQ